jgi:hypothetical protein
MAVFAGMIGVTLFGIFLTPVFYYIIRGLVGRPQRSSEQVPRPQRSSDQVQLQVAAN